MTPEERLYKEAREALEKNDLAEARKLLTQLLKINRANPEYWLWMSGAVETRKERLLCLKEALKLDPGNLMAIRGLRLADENIADPSPQPGLLQMKRDWKTSLEIETPKPAPPTGARRKMLAWTILGTLAVGILVTGVVLSLRPKYRPDTSPIMKFSLTPPSTATLGITPSPTFAGPAPLWTLLNATFTPTPLYVVTPHARTEAYQAAMRAYEKGNWSQALEYFKQVLNDEPNSPDMQYYIGEIYRFQGEYKNAINAYDSAIKIDPSFAPAYLGKGRAQMHGTTPDIKAAKANFQKAFDLDPQLYEAVLELADISITENDADSALAWIDRLPETMSSSATAETIRAQAHLLQGDNQLALIAIEKANQQDITSLPVYKIWAEILQANGQFKNSIKPLDTYLTYKPDDAQALILLAQAQVSSGNLETALVTLNQALSTNNKLAAGFIARGDIYLQKNEIDLADNDFDSALRLDPKSVDANIGKVRISLLQDFPGLAYEYAKDAVANATNDRQEASALYWRAITLIKLNEKNAAKRDLETILAFPKNVISEAVYDQALVAYLPLVTPTPSMTPTATATPTITPTPASTYTSTPTK